LSRQLAKFSTMMIRLLLPVISCIFAVQVNSFAPTVGRFFRSYGNLAMVVTKDVNMPALSSTMTEGKIVAWNKKVGEKVSAGDVLLIVESDKADMDVEAYEDGYLAAIYTPEGESAAVGAAVATLVENLADIGSVGSAPVVSAPVATPAVTAVSAPAAEVVAPASPSVKFEQVTMPALSSTMTEGKVVSWSKKIGDKISAGDMVLIVESDKADMDVESFEEGFLAVILVNDGESTTVGSPVGLMAMSVAEIPAVQAYAAGMKSGGGAIAAPSPPAPGVEVSVAVTSVTPLVVTVPKIIVTDGRVASSGYAKAMAKELNIDLRTVTSSRADGLVTSKDLSSGLSSGSTAVSSVSSYVPAAGTINASPMARKLAAENNLDVQKIKGTGNFGRVMPDDVLIAAGKKTAPVVPTSVAVVATTTAAAPAKAKEAAPVLEGVVAMDGMQKAVAKNMEKTLTTPIFRVSR
jgi:pyruvate/2-oxoglutarate dehydrogenase complex dihydrolipoamide acyltransferase (E2) component